MDTQTQKYIFLESDWDADNKNINRSKIEKLGKNMQILQDSVRYFEYLMNLDSLQNLYSIDPYWNEDILKFWQKSVNIYAWFCITHKMINFPWYDIIKNDDVTILRSTQLEQISWWWMKFGCNQTDRFWKSAVTHIHSHTHTLTHSDRRPLMVLFALKSVLLKVQV